MTQRESARRLRLGGRVLYWDELASAGASRGGWRCFRGPAAEGGDIGRRSSLDQALGRGKTSAQAKSRLRQGQAPCAGQTAHDSTRAAVGGASTAASRPPPPPLGGSRSGSWHGRLPHLMRMRGKGQAPFQRSGAPQTCMLSLETSNKTAGSRDQAVQIVPRHVACARVCLSVVPFRRNCLVDSCYRNRSRPTL